MRSIEAKVTDTDLAVRNAREGFDILGWVLPLVGHDIVELRDDPLLCRRIESSNARAAGGRNSHVQLSLLVIDHFDDLVARDGLTLTLSHRVLLGGDARQHIA